MRIVVQRVSTARVTVGDETVGQIGPGLLLLVGVEDSDGPAEVAAAALKIATLRIFADEDGLMNRSLLDTGGEALVVSQFTLLADVRKGRRPSFTAAGASRLAEALVGDLVTALGDHGIRVETGRFGALMGVSLVNDGPVTLIVDVRNGRVL